MSKLLTIAAQTHRLDEKPRQIIESRRPPPARGAADAPRSHVKRLPLRGLPAAMTLVRRFADKVARSATSGLRNAREMPAA